MPHSKKNRYWNPCQTSEWVGRETMPEIEPWHHTTPPWMDRPALSQEAIEARERHLRLYKEIGRVEAMRNQGKSVSEIAMEFGVSESALENFIFVNLTDHENIR